MQTINNIHTILWDLDGTILDFDLAEQQAIRSCFQIFHMGSCTDVMLADYSAINQHYWEMLERREISKAEILTGRFHDFFEKYGLDSGLAAAFNDEYQIRLGDTVCFLDHADDVIRELQGSVKQYIVTNGTPMCQTRKLKESGLDQMMDGVFISEVVGYEKPDKRFFDEVFRQIGESERTGVMIVGDSLTSDIRGGNQAGIQCCWYNKAHEKKNIDVQIDYEIDDLQKILAIMKRKCLHS